MSQQQNRFRALSLELIALVILIPFAVFLTTKIWHKTENPRVQIVTSPNASVTPLPSATTTASPSIEPPTPTITTQPSATPQAIGKIITLNFQEPTNNFSYKITATKKLTVIEAMQKAQPQGLVLKIKDYGAPLGILIEGINNTDNDTQHQKYWTLYVNNVRSAVGASTATVEPGDTVTWKFENTTL